MLTSNWINPPVGTRYPSKSMRLYGVLEETVSCLGYYLVFQSRDPVFHIPHVQLEVLNEFKEFEIQAQ